MNPHTITSTKHQKRLNRQSRHSFGVGVNFTNTFEYYQKIIDKNLKSFFNELELSESKNPLIKEQLKLLKNFCLLPGKRLRPILAIMAYQAVSSPPASALAGNLPVLSLELYHNHTLIHDDIYDEDTTRRGRLAYHFLLQKWFEKRYKNGRSRFGVVAGFIGGKILRTLVNWPIFQSDISSEKKIEILKLFEKLDISDNFGQAVDLFFEKENKITPDDYFEMVRLKTGGLFKASVELGAILGGATLSQRRALQNYAENLAYVFQIKDDLLDLSIGGEKGRGAGSDIKKGKKTLLLISAINRANQAQKRKIFKIIDSKKAAKKEIKEIIRLYHQLGAVDFCEEKARQKIKKAIAALKKAQPKLNDRSQRFFEDLANFMLEREK